ncbi:MAG: tRNA 2-thiouridine(34) synthase MnmA [Firmicutes bacterium]|nr:tRNA 2-thiouridine(34) synthase MnmA [Bacillota bacterium]
MAGDKVMVAMSGGVDSSVAAYLLKQQGYEVVGVTLQIWPGSEAPGGCCGWSAIDDARQVAASLGIPHYVFNYRSIFEEQVVQYFCSEYLAGRTPNPCIACNRAIKFGAMLEQAGSLGMDYLATGHYVRVERREADHRYLLLKGLDRRKDQSYVLYNLTQPQLSRLVFPLGGLTKTEVRSIAAGLDLPVAGKPESQEICFIPDNDYGGFVASRHPDAIRPGPIIDTDGAVIGQHRGIARYTIGQRRGMGVAAGSPRYVVSLDPETNTVVVGDESQVFSDSCTATDINLISIAGLTGEMEVEAKIRYAAPPTEVVISPGEGGTIEVRFKKPVRAITPGQAVVFYQGDVVVGGGTIK